MVEEDVLRRRPPAEDLDEVGVGKHIEKAAPHGAAERDEVPPPHLFDREVLPHPVLRVRVDRMALNLVHGAEQEVPGVRREHVLRLALAARDVVDLQAELDRKAAPFRLEHGVDVGIEIVDTAVGVIGLLPELPGLPEVVDVLGETDLVHAALGGHRDEALGRFDGVIDLLHSVGGTAQVHVVVDDHNQDWTSSRSSAVVTFSSRGSPATVLTRPPAASTREEQSLAPATSPPRAVRRMSPLKACGVCTAASSPRSSVSTTSSPRTRLTVSASGSAGTAPSHPSASAVTSRSTTSAGSRGRAAS